MASVQVRDLPEDVVATLKVRAAREGRSLESYLRSLFIAEAATLTPQEAAEQARAIGARSRATAGGITAAANASGEPLQ
ncbi:hypothetical protein [Streptomyces sp. NPDC048639]|uniref:FitA-like ribbon-helix-helix domain-containing protein n=1 Tax=Streptomyces sp. NPDC048639 TaxID=3365581 RepID=UPI0037231A31